jgi:hypothetical protein
VCCGGRLQNEFSSVDNTRTYSKSQVSTGIKEQTTLDNVRVRSVTPTPHWSILTPRSECWEPYSWQESGQHKVAAS